MHPITFQYLEKEYNGFIASSTIKEPYFHWLFFTDATLTEMIGDDCVAFSQRPGGPLQVYNHIPMKHRELAAIAERLVRDYLAADRRR